MVKMVGCEIDQALSLKQLELLPSSYPDEVSESPINLKCSVAALSFPKAALQIKQDDKFFSRLLSKESSRANPSLRVYFGGASGAVPFMWESQPGTPKHAFSDTVLPPLTPPPAYHCTSKKKPIKNHSRSNLLHALFLKISPKKSINVSPYPSPSTSSSSLSSSKFAPISTPTKYHGRRRVFSQSSSSFESREDDEGQTVRSPTSTLCFRGIGRRSCYRF